MRNEHGITFVEVIMLITIIGILTVISIPRTGQPKEDAAYTAANYLLHKGGLEDLQKAVWHYNQDRRYVKRVMRYLRFS